MFHSANSGRPPFAIEKERLQDLRSDSYATALTWNLIDIPIEVERPVSRKSRKLFGLEKPFLKLRHPYSVKLVFSCIVKGIKINITAKFHASRRLRFEDTKSIMAPEMRPKSFGTFEKQAPDPFQSTHARQIPPFQVCKSAYEIKIIAAY